METLILVMALVQSLKSVDASIWSGKRDSVMFGWMLSLFCRLMTGQRGECLSAIGCASHRCAVLFHSWVQNLENKPSAESVLYIQVTEFLLSQFWTLTASCPKDRKQFLPFTESKQGCVVVLAQQTEWHHPVMWKSGEEFIEPPALSLLCRQLNKVQKFMENRMENTLESGFGSTN